jgi:V8-like Glu-specific endopeptidase
MTLAIVFLVIASAFGVQAPDRYQDMTVRSIKPLVSTVTAPKGIVWKQDIRHPEPASAIRVHIVVRKHLPTPDWAIRIRDLEGRHIDTFQGNSPLLAAGEVWSREIAGTGAIVELVADVEGVAPQIEVNRYAFRVGVKPSLPLTFIPIAAAPFDIQTWAEPIVRLRFIEEGQQFTCSGFLVHRTLIMTAEFCAKTDSAALSMIADFGFDGERAKPKSLRVKSIEAHSESLGYALVRLADAPDGFGPATLSEADAVVDQQIVVIQHPGGGPKQVSGDCTVGKAVLPGPNGAGLTDFGYDCATSGGSSGSPVIDRRTGRVVGVHRLGAISPGDLKQAVHAARILADLKARVPRLYDELRSSPSKK